MAMKQAYPCDICGKEFKRRTDRKKTCCMRCSKIRSRLIQYLKERKAAASLFTYYKENKITMSMQKNIEVNILSNH